MKVCLVIVMGIFLAGPLWAQNGRPVINIHGFTVDGITAEEGLIIESLIRSYIAALGVVVSAESEQPAPDYTLSGSITMDQDNRILALRINRPQTDESAYYTSVHKTTGELVLKVRSIVESVFSDDFDAANMQKKAIERLTEGRIAGTWRGDGGIAVVRLQQGGQGFAIFSSGVRMELRYSIQNNVLLVTQSSPNTERFYHPVPYGVARELVSRAEPMRWELALYDNGNSLRGIKYATAVRYEGETVLEILPGSVREAEWSRTTR